MHKSNCKITIISNWFCWYAIAVYIIRDFNGFDVTKSLQNLLPKIRFWLFLGVNIKSNQPNLYQYRNNALEIQIWLVHLSLCYFCPFFGKGQINLVSNFFNLLSRIILKLGWWCRRKNLFQYHASLTLFLLLFLSK